ncbi:hypothetical protein R3P38DRAFT_2785666 [Favolaschia claudopus]|uniref:Uncharacterized protein n=1 Tax=Favolaschia claudopus TaxID=2862362 RepID=A0AAW0AV25_9AGAR
MAINKDDGISVVRVGSKTRDPTQARAFEPDPTRPRPELNEGRGSDLKIDFVRIPRENGGKSNVDRQNPNPITSHDPNTAILTAGYEQSTLNPSRVYRESKMTSLKAIPIAEEVS